ncbi:S-layer homology domain-containing protein [uncultured Neglectibacter sp.]|uniref:S-layer homology domain-containing protein n=1 Tax=uncultured Neglectibacter sp. TaxID=1924108 RepID=UPI0034E0303A
MKKRISSLMLVLTMLLGLLPTGAMAAEITTISTKAELEVFRDSVNSGNACQGKTVTLTADIDLNGSEENPWTPIGTSANQFQGAFDGGGHKITGLYINDSSSSAQGLFGCIGEGGTVKNLGVDGSVTGDSSIGGVVGTNKGTVENCYNTAAVTGRTWVGGVVGENYETTVRYCYNTGAVTSTINDSDIGGVIGFSRSTVTGCYYDNSVYTAAGTTSGVTGMPTADFAAQSSFSGWDFDTVWQMDAALGRPILRAAKEEPPHTHAVSTDCSATEGTQVNFTAWNKTDSLPDTAGNYVLTGDVALSKAWTVPQGTVNLCLGGHTVKVDGIFSTAAIMVPTRAALNICDCAGGGALTHRTGQPVISVVGELQLYSGVIAGRGYNSAYNGEYGVGVRSGGVFQMHGGSITGITTNTGCGVYVYDNGVFLMDGGTITGNRIGAWMQSSGSVFRVRGDVIITGNDTEDDTENVLMYDPCYMELSGPLGQNAKIGLALYWPDMDAADSYLAVQGHNGYTVTADDFAKLSSDKPEDYPLKLEDGKVYFIKPQSHSHPVCGETCAHEGDETHEAVTFDKALTAEMVNGDVFEDAYTLSEGNYYLDGDIETEKEIQVSGKVNLCFNGHTITYHGGSYKKAFITVASGAVLNTCDCRSGGGVKDTRSVTGDRETRILKAEGEAVLYGGAFNSTGAHGGIEVTYSGKLTVDGADITSKSDAVYLWQLGRLTIKSGTLKADQPSEGVVVVHSTDFIMEGGTITTDNYHAGVCFADYGSGGGANAGSGGGTISGGTIKGGIGIRVNGDQTVTLSGAPSIVANTDIYFLTSASGLLQVGDDLTGQFNVRYYNSITENSPYTFTTPADKDYSGRFTSADTSLSIRDVAGGDGRHTVQICKPGTQSHSHPVCGETCAHDPVHAAVTFDKVLTVAGGKLCVDGTALIPDSNGVYTLGGGNYYLSDDITLNASIYIQDAASAPTNLCLNGHTLDLGKGRIDIQATYNKGNGVLNLCDCGAGGKITSANYGAYSNAATIEADYQFSLYGGTVENTAASGSNKNAVGFNGGSLSLYGGKLVSRNGNGLWVNCWQTDSLTLSGNVAIQGGTDQAEVYFSYPDTTWEDSTHFALTGPLTRPAAPWRVAVDYPEAEAMPLLEGWTTHMGQANFTDYFQSATKRLFIGQLENKDLVLDICAITQQPNAGNNYTVHANGAPASVPAYQWYPATVTTTDITTENAAIYGEEYMGGCYQPSAFADGKWTASEGTDIHTPGYFTLALQRGDKVTVTLSTADKPSDGQLGLVRDFDEPGEYVQVWYPFDGDPEGYSYVGTAVTNGDNTIITYVIPADGGYDLRIDGLYGSDQTAPAISATLTRAVPGEALTGQTNPKLTAATSGNYLCRVIWSDGTAINSDVVVYTPPHSHAWATAWTSDANGHWHACTASGCGITDYANCGETGAAYGAHVYDNDQDKTCNTCGYEREFTYAISGTVMDHEGNGVSSATVTLMLGNEVIATATTDSQGNYSFSGVPAGLYNIAAEKDRVTKTILVEMTNASAVEQNIQMPEGKTNSVVEVKGSDTPAVVVGGVDAVAEEETAAPGETVTVKLTVEKQDSPADKAELDTVISGKKDDVLYLNLSLEKQINDQEPQVITDTEDQVLEIVVPYDFTGKKDVTVYRKHGVNDAEKLTGLSTRPTENFTDGRFYADGVGKVYIYASKFSTYAIGYTAAQTITRYTLTATAGRNGRIDPSGAILVRRNSNKTFAITPNEGYVVADVLVDGKSVGSVTEYTFEKITTSHTIEVIFKRAGALPAWNPFKDVKSGDWFHDSVKYVYEQGMMVGTDSTHFAPSLDTSRAMIATILWRLEDSPEPEGALTYPDCSAGSWYAKAVVWGSGNGVVKGYDNGSFGPNDPITREQLAAMLWRYAGEPATSGTLDSFPDSSKAGDWATDALRWTVEEGILTGKDGSGLLDPKGKATRAEVAAVLMRFLRK